MRVMYVLHCGDKMSLSVDLLIFRRTFFLICPPVQILLPFCGSAPITTCSNLIMLPRLVAMETAANTDWHTHSRADSTVERRTWRPNEFIQVLGCAKTSESNLQGTSCDTSHVCVCTLSSPSTTTSADRLHSNLRGNRRRCQSPVTAAQLSNQEAVFLDQQPPPPLPPYLLLRDTHTGFCKQAGRLSCCCWSSNPLLDCNPVNSEATLS